MKLTTLRTFFVNHVPKTPEQENTSEYIERNYMLDSLEVQELRNVTSVLTTSKQETSFDSMMSYHMQNPGMKKCELCAKSFQARNKF